MMQNPSPELHLLKGIETYLQGNAGEPLTRSLLDRAANLIMLQQAKIAELRSPNTLMDGTIQQSQEVHDMFMNGEISL